MQWLRAGNFKHVSKLRDERSHRALSASLSITRVDAVSQRV